LAYSVHLFRDFGGTSVGLALSSSPRHLAGTAVRRDRAGGLPALVGAAPHLPRGSQHADSALSVALILALSLMVLVLVLLTLAALRAEEMT
jgi:hypothetical protein